MELWRVLMVALALVGAVVADQPLSLAAAPTKQTLPGCNYTCGDVKIPYPFGIGTSSIPDKPCYLLPEFKLTCNNSKLYWGDTQVVDIDISQGQFEVELFYASILCNKSEQVSYPPFLPVPYFTISSRKNEFITVGCDTYGYLYSNYGRVFTACLTTCNDSDVGTRNSDGIYSTLGCCQVDIPPGMKNISIDLLQFRNSNRSEKKCSYSFIAKQGSYKFSIDHLGHLPNETFPLVVNWAVRNESCQTAQTRDDYACKINSCCVDKNTDYGNYGCQCLGAYDSYTDNGGYRCKCKEGYEGNPYLPEGCRDIDECKTSNHTCIDENHCRNTDGYFECVCPKGHGNATRGGGGCRERDVFTKVVIGVGALLLVLIFAGTSSNLIYQKRKLIKLKEKFFQQNGGFILLQQLSTREDSSQSAQIFTEHQLKKATNNYDESLIIGRGGYGTVFKGFLADNRIVAIKKSKIIDAGQIEQFINEVVILSQINHRNVVKLLGCCLETEVPLLVYEFVSNGTLFDFIHIEGRVNNTTWKTRLRIAAQVAGALSYLHSAASIPIIHRDVKSANILLDDTYTPKVSDFGASRLVPLDQTEIATMVQGTIGYLDPEYMQTNQLTEKSDVYSFGVVLVELLTGEKPFSFDKQEERRSLAMHFLSCLKKNRMFEVLQVGILNEENQQEIKEVAILAAKCLRLKGEERPSMKEVAMELEGIRLMEKHPWSNIDLNLGETWHLLHEASSSIYEPAGDSSKHGYTRYDSLKYHVLKVLDDGK